MRLTRLRLHGFKSFADEMHLEFEPGVTAIVGPNGCGKSNVSDAVRWVLGEQRARALRGSKMEEVIFQGSSARRPVNIAEVSLHFDNADGELPVPYREVVVSRRLSRSGESDYLLNGTPCRLRDIHDLMRGTGLGADAGVVIEARMIDALLSDRPDERRELFEEAAGVGLYRDRRRVTERRLEETTADLARLDDLLGEVQSQVRTLARQRKRAERHAELTARRFLVELTLASREMAGWHEELARLEAGLVALRDAVPAAEASAVNAEAAREAAHAARAAAEAHRGELARLVSAQQQEVLRLESEVKVAEERHGNALARRRRAGEELEAGRELRLRVTTDRNAASEERVALDGELNKSRDALAEAQALEARVREELSLARAALADADRQLRAGQASLHQIRLDRESSEREHAELAPRADALHADAERLNDTLESARQAAALAVRHAEETGASGAAAAERLDAARADSDAARAGEVAARNELLRTEEQVASLAGKVQALEALERERVGLAPAAARLLRERDQFGEGAVIGPFADFVTAGSSPATAVERYLGAAIHAVLVRDAAAAAAIQLWHARVNPGALLLLPADAALADDGVAGGLAEQVNASGPARRWVRALLGGVQSLEHAAAFLDARGAVWLPGATGGAGPLRRRADLAALRDSLAGAESARANAAQGAALARAALDGAERDAVAAADAHATARMAERQAREAVAEAGRLTERAEAERGAAEALASRTAERRIELQRRLAELAAQQAALDAAAAELAARHAAQGDLAAERERQQEAAREARAALQVEVAQREARVQVARDRESRLHLEAESSDSRVRALLAEVGELDDAGSVLTGRMTEWRTDLDARRLTLGDAERRLDGAERGVHECDDRYDLAERALDDARREASRAAEALHQATLRHTELSGRRTAIRERLEAEWRRPLEDMLATLEPLAPDADELRSEAAALHEELERIGPVNPLAIEEHAEEQKRLDFLRTQRDDLYEARNTLQQAIREIDATARELFLATFAEVRTHFREIFMTLFGGGECDLRLENPELPLDCDIEIHASPRGKRTQRIHLLSSGERALVALSLLFGIFLAKPSPFCLLDEVDAPLDDQNVGRFVAMLNRFKERTQFIVITHNPRTTTEAADAVYGVTMQEPGVSSFVSVRLRGAALRDDESVGVPLWDDESPVSPAANRAAPALEWDESGSGEPAAPRAS